MATAINFNWNHSKMTPAKVYNVTAKTTEGGTRFFNVWKTATPAFFYLLETVTEGTEDMDESEARCVPIFRDGASVADLLACAIREPCTLTSGEVYKMDLLTWMDGTYTDSVIYEDGVQSPGTCIEHNTKKGDALPYAYGFELEVSCRNENTYRAASRVRSNVVHMVSDASIRGLGIEFVSGALIAPKDATNPAFYEPLCNMLTGLAKSRTDDTTGLHFHISRTAFGADKAEQTETIAKVIYIENYLLNNDTLARIYGRYHGGQWCSRNRTKTGVSEHITEVAKIAPQIMGSAQVRAAMVDDLTPYDSIRRGHNYPGERYQRINITNPATVEFRQGKGDINSRSLARIAQHIDILVNYARRTSWAKLSEDGYKKSIPTTNKYEVLRAAWSASE